MEQFADKTKNNRPNSDKQLAESLAKAQNYFPPGDWGHLDCISDEQKALSNKGEKNISKYRATLTNVFGALSEVEIKRCEDIAGEWNINNFPDDIQQKYVSCNPCTGPLILHTHTDYPKTFWWMSLTFWSIWSIRRAWSSLHLWLTPMQMVNKHMQGNWCFYIIFYRSHMFIDMRLMG